MIVHAKLAVVGLLGIVAAATTVPGEAPSEVPECVAAAEWVAANLHDLPTTYEEFSTFSPIYRKTIYSKLTIDIRAALWREHLTTFMESHDLNPAQLDLLRRIQLNIGHYLELGASDEVHNVELEARAVLGDALARQAIATLGPPSDIGADAGEACSCASDSDWCPGDYSCDEDGDGCDLIEDECGTFFTYHCDGECID